MKVLLLGSGGREAALAWSLGRTAEVIVAPGNAGMEGVAERFEIDASDPAQVLAAASKVAPDVTVVGPEAPLVAGVGDALRTEGHLVFGPDASAARIEGSKWFAKELMTAAGIPTAGAAVFAEVEPAVEHLRGQEPPYVVKADGLAAGKGVVVTESLPTAVEAVRERIEERAFGDAGATVVIEEYLDGPEASLIAFVDGASVAPCEVAQDFKRAGDGDTGPNTGGMGSYSPVPDCPPRVAGEIVDRAIEPLVAEAARRHIPFVGALYAGVALTSRGPRVVEFNARFGDPETQALLPRLQSDLVDVCLAAARGDLAGTVLRWDPRPCVSVVLASEGYPGRYETGHPITGIDRARALEGVEVFCAGVTEAPEGLSTAGGRVLSVSALGDDYADARARAYEAARLVNFEGRYMRADIAGRVATALEGL